LVFAQGQGTSGWRRLCSIAGVRLLTPTAPATAAAAAALQKQQLHQGQEQRQAEEEQDKKEGVERSS